MKRLLTIILLLLSVEAVAQENTGMVLASRGDVRLSSNGETKPLRQGDFIAVGDEVSSGDRSFAVLQLYDGAKLSLHPGSGLKVIEFVMGVTAEDHALLELVQGGIKLEAGAIASAGLGQFNIKTPLSTFTVAESEVTLRLCEDDVCEHSGVKPLDP